MELIHYKGFQLAAVQDTFYSLDPPDTEEKCDYYFLSNDVFVDSFGLKQSKSSVMWGIANPHFFHVLSVARRRRTFRRIIAIDNNIGQINHFVRLYWLIRSAKDRIDYLQNLFKVTFNDKAIKILKSIQPDYGFRVRGGVTNDKYAETEKFLWKNCVFDEVAFRLSYGLKVLKDGSGLRIKARTIGDINDYYATFICCSRRSYEIWPFTAGFGSGFLRDDNAFNLLQQTLKSTPVYVIYGDITEMYNSIVYSNRYEPQVFWSSNIFCNYFMDKHPGLLKMARKLEKLGKQREPELPEIDLVVLQDKREKFAFCSELNDTFWRRRKLSVHTRNFMKIVSYLIGRKNAEVVNVREWIFLDKGVSKLPNTDYIDYQSFIAADNETFFDTLILHILVGHGISKEEYSVILRKSVTLTNNLIVFEHNRESVDFRKSGVGMTVDEIRTILGTETILDYGPGRRSADRNLIMVYRK